MDFGILLYMEFDFISVGNSRVLETSVCSELDSSPIRGLKILEISLVLELDSFFVGFLF